MARKHGISHLSVNIKYSRVNKAYRIYIDGDVFWADTYEHAVIELMKILLRDEFKPSKIY